MEQLEEAVFSPKIPATHNISSWHQQRKLLIIAFMMYQKNFVQLDYG